MVLGKLSVPGRPTNLGKSRARAYCTCSRCGLGCLDIFTLLYPFSPLSPSLWETARYRLKYCLKGPLNPKQPTNQINLSARRRSSLFLRKARFNNVFLVSRMLLTLFKKYFFLTRELSLISTCFSRADHEILMHDGEAGMH